MPDRHAIMVLIVLLLATLPSAAILYGRHQVKIRRRRLLDDLQKAYEKTVGGKGLELIPSFELARYKYDHDPVEGERPFQENLSNYVLAVPFYILVCGLGLYVVFALDANEMLRQRAFLLLGRVPWPVDQTLRDPEIEYQFHTIAALSLTFTGAYLWSILYLVRRIAVFDLSPLSFLRVTLHMLLACFVCVALRHVVDPAAGEPYSAAVGILFVAAAFTVGFYPTLGIGYVMDRFLGGPLKRNHPKATELSRHYPLDMIDGIDPFAKFRLEELDIADVQTLATRNPILLFVESPYGLFEIFDWVAQAQLIMAAGPEGAGKLRDMGIRNLYALESAVVDPATCALVGARLFEPPVDPAVCRLLVGIWGSTLHVQRFRQVWNVLSATSQDMDQRLPKRRWAAMRHGSWRSLRWSWERPAAMPQAGE